MSSHYKALTRRTNPKTVPIFPLSGAVMLPACDLPLTIFEPRYLNMVDDALKSDRLIGMIQTEDNNLAKIGGLGRICQFAEQEDGRYLIVLKGLKRFRILSEPSVSTPYRQAAISFEEFDGDAELHIAKKDLEALSDTKRSERAALTVAMKALAKKLRVEVDWEGLSQIPMPLLVNQTAMISPFDSEDKQSLLEAVTPDERRKLLTGLLHLYANKATSQAAPETKQ